MQYVHVHAHQYLNNFASTKRKFFQFTNENVHNIKEIVLESCNCVCLYDFNIFTRINKCKHRFRFRQRDLQIENWLNVQLSEYMSVLFGWVLFYERYFSFIYHLANFISLQAMCVYVYFFFLLLLLCIIHFHSVN